MSSTPGCVAHAGLFHSLEDVTLPGDDAGLRRQAAAVCAAGVPFAALNVTPVPGKPPIRVDLRALPWGDTRYPFWLSIPQYATERCLEQLLDCQQHSRTPLNGRSLHIHEVLDAFNVIRLRLAGRRRCRAPEDELVVHVQPIEWKPHEPSDPRRVQIPTSRLRQIRARSCRPRALPVARAGSRPPLHRRC